MWRSEQWWVGKLFRNFYCVRFLTICNQMWVFGCIRQLKEWETRMGAQYPMPICMYCSPEYANFSTTRLNQCLFLMAEYQSSRSRQWWDEKCFSYGEKVILIINLLAIINTLKRCNMYEKYFDALLHATALSDFRILKDNTYGTFTH